MNSIEPKLTRFDLTMIIVSLVIGIGIFRTPAIVAQKAGSPEIFFLAWIFGGLVSLCGVLTFSEIGSRFSTAGGFYKIFSKCYHPAFAFMLNWVLVIVVAASNAGVAIIGSEYIVPVLFSKSMQTETTIKLTSATILTFLFALNFAGIKVGARTQNLLSTLKIILMLGLLFGVFFVSNDSLPQGFTTTQHTNVFYAFGVSIISVFFTYGGYQHTINFGADVIQPQKNIPRAAFFGIAIILFLYVGINIAYYYALGFEGIRNSELVAAELANKIIGTTGIKITSVIIFISVLGFLNTSLMTYPRIYYAMAEDKILPKIFMKINPRTQVQDFSLLCYFSLMIINIFILGTFEKIINYVMFIDSIALATAALTIFIFRKNQREKEYTGYKIKFFPVTPIIFVVFILIVSISVLLSDFHSALMGILLFLGGFPLYHLMKRIIN